MDEVKFCPLPFQDNTKVCWCIEDECAWWLEGDQEGACAVSVLAQAAALFLKAALIYISEKSEEDIENII